MNLKSLIVWATTIIIFAIIIYGVAFHKSTSIYTIHQFIGSETDHIAFRNAHIATKITYDDETVYSSIVYVPKDTNQTSQIMDKEYWKAWGYIQVKKENDAIRKQKNK